MGFGRPDPARSAFAEDPEMDGAAPSGLLPSAVLDALRAAFEAAVPA